LVDREHGPRGYRHAVLIRVLRASLTTLRAAGLPALGLALLFVGSVAIVLPQPGVLLFIGLTAQNVVTFALVRNLAAKRGLRAALDAPPQVTRSGRPVAGTQRPGPLGDEDRSARRALGNAAYLGRAAMRLALVQLAGAMGIVLVLAAIGGGRVLPDGEPTRAQLVRVLVGAVPVAALLSAFIALVPQRLAIEGDHRVGLAVLHSIRIARAAYGTVFVLSLLEPVALLAEVAAGDTRAVRIAAVLIAPVLRLVVVAALNEVYAAAPALAVPGAGSLRR
jgi:hypothetical protein